MLTLNDGRNELWQWDTGRKLTVDTDCSQVHFSNKVFGRSVDVDVVGGVANIPDILLQTEKDLIAWAFVGTAENGYTKISKVFKINRRNKPADYVFTPPEQTTLGEILERLDKIEESQDPDAIKNAVDDYLANNPIQIKEADPTVPDWAKRPTKPTYTAKEVGAVASVNGVSPDDNGNVEITIPDSGGDSSAFYIAISGEDGNYVMDKTFPELKEAHEAGRPVYAIVNVTVENSRVNNAIFQFSNVFDAFFVFTYFGNDMLFTAYVNQDGISFRVKRYAEESSIPDKLPNPNALTFTGAVSGSYDGSAPVTLNIPDSGGNVDLTGYATEQYVKDYAQPKGDYLTEVPEGYAKTEDIPKKPEDIGAQPAGNYLTEVPSDYATKEFVTNKIAEAELGGEEVDLSGYAQKSELPTKVSQLQNDSGYLTAVPDGYAKTEDIPKNASDIGAQPEGDYALRSEIPAVPVKSVNGKTGAVSLTATDVKARPDSWMPTASDVGALPSSTVIPTVPTKVSAFTNDVGYLTEHQSLADYAKKTEIPTTLPASDVKAWAKADNKPTYTASEVGALPSTTKIPSKTSDLTNDSGFITGYTETDPTVPAWAKAASKPSYSKSEVGLGNVDNVKQYSVSNPPPYPVTSVNGKTGEVTLDAAAVGARPSTWMPTASDVGAATPAQVNAKYAKPSNGIPKTDLASAVQTSLDKADTALQPSQITLGYGSDGKVYIFANGSAVGTGIAVNGDVIGILDGDNNIVFSGALANGTYTVKYENADGTYTEVGNLIVVDGVEQPDSPTYNNLATEFQEGYRLNSSGTTSPADGTTACLDYIPFTAGTVIRVKGFNFTASNNIAFYDDNKTVAAAGVHTYPGSNGMSSIEWENEGNGVYKYTNISNSVTYARFSGALVSTTANVIITVNEPIV